MKCRWRVDNRRRPHYDAATRREELNHETPTTEFLSDRGRLFDQHAAGERNQFRSRVLTHTETHQRTAAVSVFLCAGQAGRLASRTSCRCGPDSFARVSRSERRPLCLSPRPHRRRECLGPALRSDSRRIAYLRADCRWPALSDIAVVLGIATSTVKTHLLRVFDKTGCSRLAELVKLAASMSLPVRARSVTFLSQARPLHRMVDAGEAMRP
jgi:hypothetical protein